MGKLNFANLKKTAYYLKRNGLKHTWNAAAERIFGGAQPAYRWEPVQETELRKQRERSASGFSDVTFSILVPTYRTPEGYLRELIASVQNQTYPKWELILADASGDESVKNITDTYEDERIRYVKLPGNDGIAENTNGGLEAATGDFVGLLDHDDILTENALYEMADRIEREKQNGIELQLLYSDEDKCNGDRTSFYEPNLKEKFNLDLLLTNNYICHFTVMRRELMQKLKFRGEYNGAQDFDLVLRAAYELFGQEEKIAHIDRVLYHWRCHTSSTAENPQSKLYAYDAGRRAVQDFADRKGWEVKVTDTEHLGFYKIEYLGDIFEMRPEIGAVGGPLIHRRKVAGGRMTESGEVFYQGLPVSFSGYLHRAVLQQDAEVLDVRNMELSPACKEIYRKITGEIYRTQKTAEGFETVSLPEDRKQSSLSTELSLAFCKAIREAGFQLLYLPERKKEI